MKNSAYLIILLAIALIFATYKWVASPAQNSEINMENTAIQNIMTRSSVRAYSDKAVSAETVDTLLRAAMSAPSACNKQPWRFVVINDKALLKSIGENFQSMTMAAKAPLAIVMCGDTTATLEGEGCDYWVQDVSAATENLLLAAHAEGLGAVWCGIYPISERIKKFSEMLHLPDNIIPMACVCIGYPAGPATPKDKWKPEHIRYNTWDSSGSNGN